MYIKMLIVSEIWEHISFTHSNFWRNLGQLGFGIKQAHSSKNTWIKQQVKQRSFQDPISVYANSD